MQKIMNRTLGGKIVETSSMRNQYNEEIYQVTFMRVDNRKMTVSVDKDIFDKCINSNMKAIFDIDVVMEKEGDINHYDKELTKAKKVLFLGMDISEKVYAEKMDEDLVWLSRYAKPLPPEKSKAKEAALNIGGYLGSILLLMILFGVGIGAILAIPFTINIRRAEADKYTNYEVTKGQVIKQSSHQVLDEDYYTIEYEIEYEVDDVKYVIKDRLERDMPSILSEQYVLYDKSEPSNGLLCGYNKIAKAYLPGLQKNQEYAFFVILVIVSIAFILVGIKQFKSIIDIIKTDIFLFKIKNRKK